MAIVTRKLIKVLTNGPIRAKGWVYGPILTPYYESTKIIFAMLCDGIKVVEILNNGTELELNATNFNKDNNVATQEPVKDEIIDDLVPAATSFVAPIEEPVVTEPVQETVVESTPTFTSKKNRK